MKKTGICFILMLITTLSMSAQKNQLSLRLSTNQTEISYQHQFLSQKTFAAVYTGLANHDLNSAWDDVYSGIKMGIKTLTNSKNQLDLHVRMGMYYTNNSIYDGFTPVIGGGIGYAHYWGASKKHCLLIDLGLQYGRRSFMNEYETSLIQISGIESFRITPLYISIGYGINF